MLGVCGLVTFQRFFGGHRWAHKPADEHVPHVRVRAAGRVATVLREHGSRCGGGEEGGVDGWVTASKILAPRVSSLSAAECGIILKYLKPVGRASAENKFKNKTGKKVCNYLTLLFFCIYESVCGAIVWLLSVFWELIHL